MLGFRVLEGGFGVGLSFWVWGWRFGIEGLPSG